jgi:endonuclease-3
VPTPNEKRAAQRVFAVLREQYPDAECELTPRDPWRLLCAVILSAQCTDVRVNLTTPILFAKYPTAEALAAADPADVEEIVKATGFFRQKTKSLISMSQDVVAKFGGKVPETLEELTTLRGVGRKTANVVIGTAFGGQGVVVDTHVKRLSKRLGWTTQTDPVKIERDLMELFPRDVWTQLGHTLIFHGRRVCKAQRPDCPNCPILEDCPDGKARLGGAEARGAKQRPRAAHAAE